MMRDAEHIFMCMFSLEKCVLRYSAYFYKLDCFLILSCISSLYILDIPLWDMSFANTFSHSKDSIFFYYRSPGFKII